MLTTLIDSEIHLDGGAMNGVVPRPLWSKHTPPDEQGRIKLVTRCVLFKEERQGRIWLIETGMGNGWDGKSQRIYGITKVNGGLLPGLAEIGMAPEEITDIVLTHLHFDHSAGTVIHGNDAVRLAFPKARIHAQKQQMEWARNPSQKDRASYRPADLCCIAASEQLVLHDGPTQLSPAVSVNPYHGHTAGMQTVTLRWDGVDYVFAADLIPIFSHIRLPWVMAYDNHPVTTVEEKHAFLDKAAALGQVIISAHDPVTAAGRIGVAEPGRYQLDPVRL